MREIVICFMSLMFAATAIAAPPLINAQGKLNTSNGSVLHDSTYAITFTIYDAVSGGTVIWTEPNPAVAVTDGQFNVLLGSIIPISSSVFSGDERYLGIKVGTDPEMMPRSRLVSVGYAQRVATVDGSVGGIIQGGITVTGNVGIGTTSPLGKLDVHGSIYCSNNDGSSGASRVSLGASGASYGAVGSGFSFTNQAGVYAYNVNDSASQINFRSGGFDFLTAGGGNIGGQIAFQNAMRIQRNGNVGIGTASPVGRLDVRGSIYCSNNSGSSSPRVSIGSSGSNYGAVGYGFSFTDQSNSYRYLANDYASQINFREGGFDFMTAGLGAIGNEVQWTQTARISPGRLSVAGTTSTCVLEITGGCDLAEPFAINTGKMPDPGTVVIIDSDHEGKLKMSYSEYDKRVAGIVSGAGGIKPGLTLKQGIDDSRNTHVALTGQVYALATASNGAIEPGDLLTTSAMAGRAMKATDKGRWDGAVIGKAMSRLERGEGLVLVLVNLQ